MVWNICKIRNCVYFQLIELCYVGTIFTAPVQSCQPQHASACRHIVYSLAHALQPCAHPAKPVLITESPKNQIFSNFVQCCVIPEGLLDTERKINSVMSLL